MGISLNEVLPFLLQMVIFQEFQISIFGNDGVTRKIGDARGKFGGVGKFGGAQFQDARNDKIGNGAEPAFSIYLYLSRALAKGGIMHIRDAFSTKQAIL